MKNRVLYIFLFIIFSNFIYFTVNSSEQFDFNITEVEILDDGCIVQKTKCGICANTPVIKDVCEQQK